MRVFLFLLILSFSTKVFSQKKMPDGIVKNLEGKEVKLSTIIGKGKVVVLSFWATWCAPCKKELDAYSLVYDEWKKNYPVEIIAVSIDQTRAVPKIAPMVKEKGWKFPVYLDENSTLSPKFGFQAIPQTYLIDKNGFIFSSHSGFTSNAEKIIEDEIKKAVKS
ncbi:MAG: hypothetical protein RJA52_723 [Bacteroidota bacterium]